MYNDKAVNSKISKKAFIVSNELTFDVDDIANTTLKNIYDLINGWALNIVYMYNISFSNFRYKTHTAANSLAAWLKLLHIAMVGKGERQSR